MSAAIYARQKQPTRPARTAARTAPRVSHLQARTVAEAAPAIQRKCACGGGCPRCAETLSLSSTGDTYEVEADRVADRVMRMEEADVQQQNSIGLARLARSDDNGQEIVDVAKMR